MKQLLLLSLALSLPPIALAQSASRVQIRKGNETVATISNLPAQLQIRADKSSQFAKGVTLLSGNIVIHARGKDTKPIHLRADQVLVESGSIEIQVYNYIYDEQLGWINHLGDVAGEPQAPRLAFLRVLKSHPTINNFRMTFTLLLAGDGANTTVLYNRRDKTLTYYESGSGDEGRQSYTKHYLYTNVTDAILTALVQKYDRDGDGYTHGHFGFLPEFGCKRIDLSKKTN